MKSMRLMWLTKITEEDKLKSKDEILAVLMDWPIEENTITVLSSPGGDASIYTTSTFGILGGIGHEKVRKAAAVFVSTAQKHIAAASPVSDFAYPDRKKLYFYLVTPSGVRRISSDISEIEKNETITHELFAAAQNVVTELRLTTAK